MLYGVTDCGQGSNGGEGEIVKNVRRKPCPTSVHSPKSLELNGSDAYANHSPSGAMGGRPTFHFEPDRPISVGQGRSG
jgi:hypothetical protein